MSGLTSIDGEELRAAISYAAAADEIERALSADSLPAAPLRANHRTDSGELLVMPSWGEPGMGVKLVAVEPDNPVLGAPLIQASFVLFSAATKTPMAVLDGAALTALRTAAVSLVGARALARPESETLCLFGAGRQAEAHLEALAEGFELRQAIIVDPVAARVEALVERAGRLGIDAIAGEPRDVARADIVCCCTSSKTPVFSEQWVAPGTHISAIGAYRPDMSELEPRLLGRSTVVVDSREVALAEAGDLIAAIAAGALTADSIAGELGDLVRGLGRPDPLAVTVLKAVGLAWEDLVVGSAAVRRLDSANLQERRRWRPRRMAGR